MTKDHRPCPSKCNKKSRIRTDILYAGNSCLLFHSQMLINDETVMSDFYKQIVILLNFLINRYKQLVREDKY